MIDNKRFVKGKSRYYHEYSEVVKSMDIYGLTEGLQNKVLRAEPGEDVEFYNEILINKWGITGKSLHVYGVIYEPKNMKDTFKNSILNGAYQDEDVLWHQHSNKLLVEFLKHFEKEVPVIDLGCGHNWYCNTLRFLGYDTRGVDRTRFPGVDVWGDITDPKFRNEFGKVKMNVISLEVGEHIPEHLALPYLDNVSSFGGDVLLSWAVPGQAGIGHINCQPNEWVIGMMWERGYKIEINKTDALRRAVDGCHCSWFLNTLMYFVKK